MRVIVMPCFSQDLVIITESFPVLQIEHVVTQRLNIPDYMTGYHHRNAFFFQGKQQSSDFGNPWLSSPFIGSSRIRKPGSSIKAMAIPSLCFIPNEYLPARV